MQRHEKLSAFEKMFWQLSRKMSYEWKKIYQAKFPGSQSHILFLLERNGKMKMSELASEVNLTPGAVTTASNHLINSGHIKRTQNENDRRVIYLALTDEGRLALTQLQKEGRKIIKNIFNDATNNELDLIYKMFEQANLNLDQLREGNTK